MKPCQHPRRRRLTGGARARLVRGRRAHLEQGIGRLLLERLVQVRGVEVHVHLAVLHLGLVMVHPVVARP
eukprot:scaffold2751_cov344-Prasinococcus_capsulatus_cf.AAC.3